MFNPAEAIAPLSPPSLAALLSAETPPAETPPAEIPTAESGPAGSSSAKTARRNKRLEAFRREQTIVEYLNRGLSLAEIASRLEVDERRLQTDVRDILARRMPQTAEEFAAIQASRLNEVLLVAYGAMTDMNLKAVDRVLRIVRALDRYCGFSPASLPRLKTDAEREAAAAGAKGDAGMIGLGGGLGFHVDPCEAALATLGRELGPGGAGLDGGLGVDARAAGDTAPGAGRTLPDSVAQAIENMDSAPGVGAALAPEAPAPRREAQPEAAAACQSPCAGENAPGARPAAARAGGKSPLPALQAVERTRFTPGVAAAAAPRPVDRAGRLAVEAALNTPAPPPTRPLDRHGLSSLAMAAILSPAGHRRAPVNQVIPTR